MDQYQTIHHEIWKRRPKTPALELTPPGASRRPEWMGLAKAMLSQGMAEKRNLIRLAFTRSLSQITPDRTTSPLARVFRQVREGVDFMLPMRSTADARRFVEINHRTANRR